MLSLSPDSKLAYTTGKQFTYTVPLASGDVAQVFNTMETSKRAHGIVEQVHKQSAVRCVLLMIIL